MKKIAVVLVLVAIFFSFFKLKESPPFWFDEGWYFQTSANLATQGIDGIQLVPGHVEHISTFVTVGYPLIYPLGLWFKIFGVSVTAGRAFMAIILLLFVLSGFLLSKRLYGFGIAATSLAMLATFPPLYGNGKSVLGEVPGMLYMGLSLLFLARGLSESGRKRGLLIILAGLAAGLCIATKPLFILIVPGLVIGAFVAWRRKQVSLKEIGLCILCAFVPIVLWLLIQFKSGGSFSETIAYYANPYHIDNIWRVILLNLKRLFSDVGTLYTDLLMGVWIVGLVIQWKKKQPIPVAEIVAFVFSALVVLAYLRTAGVYRYLFPAQAASLIFFPYSLRTIVEAFSRLSPNLRQGTFACIIGILAILGLYQTSFKSWVADAYASDKTAFWEDYFKGVSAEKLVVFYNTPEVTPFASSRNYYQYIKLFDRALGEQALDVIASGKPDQIIATTGEYQEAASTTFKAYIEKQKAYKYSILVPSRTSSPR